MKKYKNINASNNLYNLKELLTGEDFDKDKFLEAIGFTYISGSFDSSYAAIYNGTDLVLYGYDLYLIVYDGAEYADEILDGMLNGKLGLDEITEDLGLTWKDFLNVEEIR